jgi:hypothetical protein
LREVLAAYKENRGWRFVTSEQTEVSLRKQADAESARSGSTVVELMSTFPIADVVLMFDVVLGDYGGA